MRCRDHPPLEGNSESIGEVLAPLVGEILGGGPPVLDCGSRVGSVVKGRRKSQRRGMSPTRYRLTPTNSERFNRALKELGSSAFKIHALLWKWRGAPARGSLPYFTIHSLSKFCRLTRPTVRSGLLELVRLGWIRKQGYSKHHKNELYRLIPIREVPIGCDARGVAT